MAKRTPVPINTGVGRFIGGSCYTGSTTDDKGQPKVYKTGAKAGQPRTDFSVGIALPKTQAHWANEPGWGAALWAEGHAAWPAGQAQRPDFAWKVVDGDSQIPNKKMKRPCDQPGYAGHWVLWFGGTSMPRVAVAVGSATPTWNDNPDVCMPGDYIEIRGSVSSNESDKTAGMYLNIDAVCLRGYHPDGRIAAQSIDLATAGFGAALPAGAVTQPAGNALAPSAPPVPGAPPSTPVAPQPPATLAPVNAAPPAPVTVTPNAAILGAPAPVAVPAAPAPSPAVPTPPAPVATPPKRVLKNGGVYDEWVAAGWTDQALREAGHID